MSGWRDIPHLSCFSVKLGSNSTNGTGERGGSVVECRTPEREVRDSRPTAAVLCSWARHFTPRKYWLITQEAMAPSRYDWKIVDWDVKPQHNQPTNKRDGITNEHTNGRTDERKDENYIPLGINAGGNMKIGIAYGRASPSNFLPSFRVYTYIIHFIIWRYCYPVANVMS